MAGWPLKSSCAAASASAVSVSSAVGVCASPLRYGASLQGLEVLSSHRCGHRHGNADTVQVQQPRTSQQAPSQESPALTTAICFTQLAWSSGGHLQGGAGGVSPTQASTRTAPLCIAHTGHRHQQCKHKGSHAKQQQDESWTQSVASVCVCTRIWVCCDHPPVSIHTWPVPRATLSLRPITPA